MTKNPTSKLRSCLNKNKPKKIIERNPKDTTLVLCPIKEVNIYRYICIECCSHYKKCKEGGLK